MVNSSSVSDSAFPVNVLFDEPSSLIPVTLFTALNVFFTIELVDVGGVKTPPFISVLLDLEVFRSIVDSFSTVSEIFI